MRTYDSMVASCPVHHRVVKYNGRALGQLYSLLSCRIGLTQHNLTLSDSNLEAIHILEHHFYCGSNSGSGSMKVFAAHNPPHLRGAPDGIQGVLLLAVGIACSGLDFWITSFNVLRSILFTTAFVNCLLPVALVHPCPFLAVILWFYSLPALNPSELYPRKLLIW